MSLALSRAALGVTLATLVLTGSGCGKVKDFIDSKRGGGDVKLEIAKGTLSVDPLTAARELGKAAATEKSGPVLAGKLLALFERMGVPVISTDGKTALVAAPLSDPSKELYFWEPVITGLARATAQGDARPMSVLMRAFVPGVDDARLARVDFTALFAQLAAEVAADKATTSDALLVTAIAEDLATRGDQSADPRLDPVGSALFGMWLSLYQPAPPAPALPQVPALPSGFPGLPPGLKIPGLTNDLASAARHQTGGGDGASCGFMEPAMKGLGALKTGVGWASKVGKYLPGKAGAAGLLADTMMEVVDKFAKIPGMVMEGIVGMGIAAFVDIDGKVEPTLVKYGDGPATFEVTAVSHNPFTKQQMESFINCLQARNPLAAPFVEELRNMPPRGKVADAPVVWFGWERIDPRHGTFTVDRAIAAPPKGVMETITATKRTLAAKAKVSLTDGGGKGTAKFQVKKKKGERVTTVTKSYLVFATLFPFPLGLSPIYGGANLIANREVPLRLEIEVPFPKNWVLTMTEETTATGDGLYGGWKLITEAKVPFSLDPKDPKMRFTARGTGTWTVGFEGGVSEIMHCSVATGAAQPLDVTVEGAVQNAETFDTEFKLDVRGRGGVSSRMKCIALGGIKVDMPFAGPANDTNAAAGTNLARFVMPIEEDGTRSFTTHSGAGNGAIRRVSRITLTPAE